MRDGYSRRAAIPAAIAGSAVLLACASVASAAALHVREHPTLAAISVTVSPCSETAPPGHPSIIWADDVCLVPPVEGIDPIPEPGFGAPVIEPVPDPDQPIVGPDPGESEPEEPGPDEPIVDPEPGVPEPVGPDPDPESPGIQPISDPPVGPAI